MYKPFTLFKRPTTKKRKYIYYCQFRDENGKRMTAVSTGKSTKAEAEAWAYNKISKGKVGRIHPLRFADFAKDFFVWDRCKYLAKKKERGSYSKSYAEGQRSLLVHHILPYFADSLIDTLTIHDIEDWLITVKHTSSIPTANRALTVIKIMLKEAVRRGITPTSPADQVEKLPEISGIKGILTQNEIRQLFNNSALESVWKGNIFHQTLNALAFTTAMRMGEIQALRWCDLKEEYIEINHSWDRKYGLTQPKAKSNRIVPLLNFLSPLLYELKLNFAESDSFIFHGNSLQKPIDHKAISKHFYNALKNIGIDEDHRKSRRLTFHSWRHTFHAILRGSINDVDLRRITGHKTETMTDHYDHNSLESIQRISPIIEKTLLRYK